MKTIALVAALASSGCFTSWVVTQAANMPGAWDEDVREERVPLAGVDERFAVSLPLDPEFVVAQGTNTTATTRTEQPFALTCTTKQQATDRIYHSAFRYGSRWKKMSGGMFIAEALVATAFLLLDQNRDLDDPVKAADRRGLLVGGFLALDAVGTLAIFFIPRKEVFTVEDRGITTPIRDDCPDGLVLEIAGDAFPVNAAGRIGEVGEVALDDWMRAPTGTIALTLGGRALPLRLEGREQCAWMRARHPDDIEATQRTCYAAGIGASTMQLPRVTTALISVPAGSLSMVEPTPPATDSR